MHTYKNHKKINVAHVIGKLYAGGVENVVFNYYKCIDKSRVNFDFFYDADSIVEPPAELIETGAKFYKIPPYQHLPQYIKSLEAYFRKNNYQIVHSHMNTLSVFPMFVAWKVGVPIRIAHNHSVPGKGETKKNVLKYALKPFAKTFPTHYFACSKYAGEWLFGEDTFQNGEVTVINNAIDVERFKFNKQVRNEVRNKLGIADKFVVGNIGRFCYQKNHDFLIDVFNEVHKREQNSVLLLVGAGELEDEIRKKVKRLGLEDCVQFLGVHNDVDRLYQAMDVFVLPSRYEGLGMVAVEAQASGLQCIVSECVPKEVACTDNISFLKLIYANHWADEILKYKNYQRTDTSQSIKNAGFDIKVEAKKLQDMYGELVRITM